MKSLIIMRPIYDMRIPTIKKSSGAASVDETTQQIYLECQLRDPCMMNKVSIN